MSIRRNKDGQQNITDLRRALEARDNVTIFKQGGNWILSVLADRCWHQTTLPYYYTERMAIQKALFGNCESPDEASYHRRSK